MSGRTYSAASQCHGKRPYSAKRFAKKAAREQERSVGRLVAYRCSHCGLWHLGHKPTRGYVW